MKAITLYMHVHQPYRVREYSVFDTAINHDYFEDKDVFSERNNRYIFEKVANKSYRPMNALLEKLLHENPDFKLSLSITGTFIDQAKEFAPDVLDSFRRLVKTGRVEIVAETYHHSLAFFYSREEFENQVKKHRDLIRAEFGVETKVFRNTELSYNDDLARWADDFGFDGILAEGWDPILQWRSPGFVYRPAGVKNIKLLMKNYKLSDDLAFRFGNRNWEHFPLDLGKYVHWLDSAAANGGLVNLFMDYETFGEHQWADTGIFNFFENLVNEWTGRGNKFFTTSEAINSQEAISEISMPHTVTWADSERDLTAWLGNSLQQEALKNLYQMENDVLNSGDDKLIEDWRRLQTSDHPYYMCTKWLTDGDVHAYFSPYKSPYEAFLYFMNAIRDMRWRIEQNKQIKGGI